MTENSSKSRNRVLESKKAEKKSRAELARKCDMSEQTFKRVESGQNITLKTRWKVVDGFNSLDHRKREYTEEYLFPNDAQQERI